jgi:chromosome segregation ATPase
MGELINYSPSAPGRSVSLIAAEINSIKEQTRKMVLYNSIEIGRRLVEAKQLLSHGEWGEWLEKSVDYSQRTANNLMRIFDEYGSNQITFLSDNAKSQALANLSYTQAIAMLGVPSEERENFIQEHDLDNMSTRELQKAIKEREQAIKEKEDAEKAAEAVSKTLESLSKENENLKNETSKEREARLKAEREASELNKQIENGIKQREVYLQQIDEFKAKLKDAENSGNIKEVMDLTAIVNTLEDKVNSLLKEKEELEHQLNEKPVDVNEIIVEKIPDEVVQELQDLRAKASQPSGGDKAAVKFSLQFDGLVKGFKDLLGTLEEIQDHDTKEKYKAAVRGLIGKMAERL